MPTMTDITNDGCHGPWLRNPTEEFTASNALSTALKLLAQPGLCQVIYASPKAGAEAVQLVKDFLSAAGAEVSVDERGILKLFNGSMFYAFDLTSVRLGSVADLAQTANGGNPPLGERRDHHDPAA